MGKISELVIYVNEVVLNNVDSPLKIRKFLISSLITKIEGVRMFFKSSDLEFPKETRKRADELLNDLSESVRKVLTKPEDENGV